MKCERCDIKITDIYYRIDSIGSSLANHHVQGGEIFSDCLCANCYNLLSGHIKNFVDLESTPEGDRSFVYGCYLIGRFGDGPMFTSKEGYDIITLLHDYALIPLEHNRIPLILNSNWMLPLRIK